MDLLKFEMEMRRSARAPMEGLVATSSIASTMETGQSSILEDPPVSIVSMCNCEKITSIFGSFDTQKANIVNSTGFGGLLKLPFLKDLDNQLCLSLYEKFDSNTMCLHVAGGVDLELRDADVHLIYGIPFEGPQVNCGMNLSEETIKTFQQKLLSQTTSSSSLTLSFLEQILMREYGPVMSQVEIDAFKIATVLVAMFYLLAPLSQDGFPMHLVNNFLTDVKPAELNWAQFVLWILGQAASDATKQLSSGMKNITLFGCSHLLQVFYLDNLNFGPCTPYHIVLPRASAYSSSFMSEVIASDCTISANGEFMFFQNSKVRPGTDVCYTRGWQDHVKMQSQLPHITEDDYLTSIQILSEGIRFADNFANEFKNFNSSTLKPLKGSLVDTESSYLNFKSKNNDKIHSLLSRTALLVKNQIISLYRQHIPKTDGSTMQKRLPIGTSVQPVMKRTKCFGENCIEGVPLSNPQQVLSYPTFSTRVHTEQTATYSLAVPSSHIIPQHGTTQRSREEQLFGTITLTAQSRGGQAQQADSIVLQFNSVPWTNKFRCYYWLNSLNLPTQILDRNWIVFNTPKPLTMTGHVARECLKASGKFNIGIVDAIMVLWDYLDEKAYNNNLINKRTRHFLPAYFAYVATHHRDHLNSPSIRGCFVGDHITYNLQECEQIIIPVLGRNSTWSCYFYNFKMKTITVLDPVLMNCPTLSRFKNKHHDIVFGIHSALFLCKDKFFPGWDVQSHGWTEIYITDAGPKSHPENSGLYAVDYARYYNGGQNRSEMLTKGKLADLRGEILYHLFTCPKTKVTSRISNLMKLCLLRPER